MASSLLCFVFVLHLFCCPASSASSSTGDVKWIRTAKDTSDRLTVQTPNLTFSSDFNFTVGVTINRSLMYQTIVGFGGAFTDSASYVFSKLNSTHQAAILNMYFSEDGLRYNMGRLPIGSCDFSYNHYTYDEVRDDENLTHFTIEHDKGYIIPFIREANATLNKWSNDSLYILASPWSPPAWMKVLDLPYCPLSCLECRLKDKYKKTWAEYFVKFIEAYGGEGVRVWGVTVQNEPGACPVEYEGMHFDPETQRDFIKEYLGPSLRSSHPDVKLLIYDHNKNHVVKWVETIFSDPEASSYAWGTAVHWYSGDDFENLQSAHSLQPGKPILATEATVAREKNPENPKWEHGEHYAHDMIGDFNNWVVGFIDWNLLLDRYGGPNHAGPQECEGLIKCGSAAMILADLETQVLYPQVFYYYVGHISKYVPRGSVRINSRVTGSSSLECVAFLTPEKSIVVIVMNTGDESVEFKLADVATAGAAGEQSVQALKVQALPHSIQTFLYT
ncbi:PREDICTED: putative glucosylceramidase 3 [Amphimedon queenslandica]|uniref:Glucosylceramidase n=1 Tax=Amphimedon queenslandica TaxID=400682 RepID=A0A1X7UXW7_AMPQE|nr:PREDICTED: putative glucosylceramidase 3 [Amphimedon queenslandica]|eukprot:XP_019851801.1 PREDICTED: putative glucosylceramidase 3 [Amphimedon queenslandica]